jgi:hypothetical protein
MAAPETPGAPQAPSRAAADAGGPLFPKRHLALDFSAACTDH